MFTHSDITQNRRIPERTVTVAGFSCPSFQEAITVIKLIDNVFSRHFPSDAWLEWTPAQFDGHDAIQGGCRVLTPKRQIKGDVTPFQMPDFIASDEFIQRAVERGHFIFMPENLLRLSTLMKTKTYVYTCSI